MQFDYMLIDLDSSGNATQSTNPINGQIQMIVASKLGGTANPAITIEDNTTKLKLLDVTESGAINTVYPVRLPAVLSDGTAITDWYIPYPSSSALNITVTGGDADSQVSILIYWVSA